MKRKIVLGVLFFILFAVLIVSTLNLLKVIGEYRQAADTYQSIQEQYVSTEQSEDTAVADEYTPTESEAIPISIDFPALLEMNKDIVGWIYCPDTVINYPVVQGKDNNEYLRHDLNGKYLISGTVFVDYRNETVGSDSNYILYGHNMKDDTMFGSIVKYKDQSYFDSHPIMYYLTPDKSFKIELLAGYVTPRDSEVYNNSFGTQEPLDKFMESAIKKSTFKSNAEYVVEDKLITLSTCSYEYSNARYVIIGKLNIIE